MVRLVPRSCSAADRPARRGSASSGRPRLGQVERRQRAQECVRDEHVDRGLGRLVHRHAEPGRDRRVEVRHLDLDPESRPAVRALAGAELAHVERQEAAATPRACHEQPVADPPLDLPVLALQARTREPRSAAASAVAQGTPLAARSRRRRRGSGQASPARESASRCARGSRGWSDSTGGRGPRRDTVSSAD